LCKVSLLHHNSSMKKIFFLLGVISLTAHAQKNKKAAKADKAIIANLQMHVGYLADDKLEGRRTGTAGEKLAYEYISGEK
jgi:aminopeptidase YwaD